MYDVAVDRRFCAPGIGVYVPFKLLERASVKEVCVLLSAVQVTLIVVADAVVTTNPCGWAATVIADVVADATEFPPAFTANNSYVYCVPTAKPESV